MGGVVLVFSVILWWAGEYPKSPVPAVQESLSTQKAQAATAATGQYAEKENEPQESAASSIAMKHTYIGRVGRVIEPLVRPFGSDWRGAVSLVTGFVAKEVVVSSMGVLYAVGEEVDEENELLRQELRRHFSPLAGIAFMLFVLLYTPCVVALVTVVRELKSWKWSLFSVGYQVVFAWTAATAVFQIGRLLGFT
jgi:ferrous iron transport protein B